MRAVVVVVVVVVVHLFVFNNGIKAHHRQIGLRVLQQERNQLHYRQARKITRYMKYK
jgi:hypothetical protein